MRGLFEKLMIAFGRPVIDKERAWKKFQREPFTPTADELQAVQRFQGAKLKQSESRATGGHCLTFLRFIENWPGQVERAIVFSKLRPQYGKPQSPPEPGSDRETQPDDSAPSVEPAPAAPRVPLSLPPVKATPTKPKTKNDDPVEAALKRYCQGASKPFSLNAVTAAHLTIANQRATEADLVKGVEDAANYARSNIHGKQFLPSPLKMIEEEAWRNPSAFGNGTQPNPWSDVVVEVF